MAKNKFIHVHESKQWLMFFNTLQCVKSVRHWNFFWPVCSRIRADCEELQSKSPYSVRIWENTDKKNSQYGHFSCSVICRALLILDVKCSTKFFSTLFIMTIPEDICFRKFNLVFMYKKKQNFPFLPSPDSFNIYLWNICNIISQFLSLPHMGNGVHFCPLANIADLSHYEFKGIDWFLMGRRGGLKIVSRSHFSLT